MKYPKPLKIPKFKNDNKESAEPNKTMKRRGKPKEAEPNDKEPTRTKVNKQQEQKPSIFNKLGIKKTNKKGQQRTATKQKIKDKDKKKQIYFTKKQLGVIAVLALVITVALNYKSFSNLMNEHNSKYSTKLVQSLEENVDSLAQYITDTETKTILNAVVKPYQGELGIELIKEGYEEGKDYAIIEFTNNKDNSTKRYRFEYTYDDNGFESIKIE